MGLCSIAFYREVQPFRAPATNVLNLAAQYTVTVVYGGALVLETDVGAGVDHVVLGAVLLAANLFVVGLVVGMAWSRSEADLREVAARQGRLVRNLELAHTFSAAKFATTLNAVELTVGNIPRFAQKKIMLSSDRR